MNTEMVTDSTGTYWITTLELEDGYKAIAEAATAHESRCIANEMWERHCEL